MIGGRWGSSVDLAGIELNLPEGLRQVIEKQIIWTKQSSRVPLFSLFTAFPNSIGTNDRSDTSIPRRLTDRTMKSRHARILDRHRFHRVR